MSTPLSSRPGAGARALREPLRVSVVGAECTGKSSLCEALAQALPGLWLPEVLRDFCDRHGRTPRVDEQAALTAEQIAREDALQASARSLGLGWVVFDSSPLVTALYSVACFDDASLMAAAIAHQRRYDLTLMAGIDLPWVADRFLRDGPAARAAFHHRLAEALAQARIAHTALRGPLAERLDTALRASRPPTATV